MFWVCLSFLAGLYLGMILMAIVEVGHGKRYRRE